MITHKLACLAAVLFLGAQFLCSSAFPTSTAAGSISGTVAFEDGKPAPGARVEWLSLDATEGLGGNLLGDQSVLCKKDGSFRIDKLGKGPFRLQVTARAADALSDWFVVVPSTDVGASNVTVVVKRGHSVSGRVVDKEGKPVTTFKIAAHQTYEWKGGKGKSGPAAREFKDSEGNFTLEGLPPGDWEFFIPLTNLTTQSPFSQKTVRVTLPFEGKPIVLVAPPTPPMVAGRVLDSKGQPILGAEVLLTPQAKDDEIVCTAFKQYAKTNEKGVFSVEVESGRRYQLTVLARGYKGSAPVDVEASNANARDVLVTLVADGKSPELPLEGDENN